MSPPRPLQPSGSPHRQDCRSLAVGLRAQLAGQGVSGVGAAALRDASLRFKLPHAIVAWALAHGSQAHNPCAPLTYGNPFNV